MSKLLFFPALLTDPVRCIWMAARNVLVNHERARAWVSAAISDRPSEMADRESVFDMCNWAIQTKVCFADGISRYGRCYPTPSS